MKNRDNLHFRWGQNLSYNKTWNFAIGERESGKSTDGWILIWKALNYKGRPSIVFRRRIADISAAYIEDTATLLNKFLEQPIQLLYQKGDIKNGIVDVRIAPANVKVTYAKFPDYPIFFRVIGLSTPMNRIKSLVLRDVAFMFYDEFIANVRGGERYLEQEMFRIQEIYTTYNREASTPIRIIAAGNPYSVYCPLFMSLGVDTAKLKPGAFVVGPNYTINCFQVSRELKAQILKNNPMYQFDDAYARYAFKGEAVNDSNIKLQKYEPKGFKLKYVFKLGNDYVSIHKRGPNSLPKEKNKYWFCTHNAEWLDKIGDRKVIVFNFADMIDNSYIPSPEDCVNFMDIKRALRERQCFFNNINASYMAEDIFGYM